MTEPHGDVPGPMLSVEQQQALERLLEVRELMGEIETEIDRERCVGLLDELEQALAGR